MKAVDKEKDFRGFKSVSEEVVLEVSGDLFGAHLLDYGVRSAML